MKEVYKYVFASGAVARYKVQFPISEPDVVAIRKSNG